MLTGRYPKDSVPLSERLQDRLGILLFSLMLFPFVAMAGGMILMGMLAFSHNDRALLIGLPAGFALLLTLAGFVTFMTAGPRGGSTPLTTPTESSPIGAAESVRRSTVGWRTSLSSAGTGRAGGKARGDTTSVFAMAVGSLSAGN